jgi:hypothetical protein
MGSKVWRNTRTWNPIGSSESPTAGSAKYQLRGRARRRWESHVEHGGRSGWQGGRRKWRRWCWCESEAVRSGTAVAAALRRNERMEVLDAVDRTCSASVNLLNQNL